MSFVVRHHLPTGDTISRDYTADRKRNRPIAIRRTTTLQNGRDRAPVTVKRANGRNKHAAMTQLTVSYFIIHDVITFLCIRSRFIA